MSQIIKQGKIHFQSEARLLQELGERLVASPEVALIELIKNSYDADASKCTIAAPNLHTLSITDDGLGMTYSDFEGKWMRIATGSKQIDRLSKKYRRKMTGAKGIGRFAARFLGKELHLESVAFDPKEKCKTRIIADFCWENFDSKYSVNPYNFRCYCAHSCRWKSLASGYKNISLTGSEHSLWRSSFPLPCVWPVSIQLAAR